MIYKALNKALEQAAIASLTSNQFVFFIFSGLSAAEDLLASGSFIN
jgi:hypothetical protein